RPAPTHLYADEPRFRSTIDMEPYRYGRGEYHYFAHPLPDLVAELRAALWPRLLPIARDWAERRGQEEPRRLARPVPPGRPDPPDAADAALRARRLERPAPRPLRRAGLPPAGGDRPRPT